jgi:hypothetical protein
MLERIGFDGIDLPDLRYVTQAGGRLPPERVRSFAALGERRGWQLFVMYGATEATARMAFLPPELAQSRPASIGRPIPGGSFTIEPLDECADPDVGELVYHGANVMMGYAGSPADLALGKTVDTLRTGDVARRAPDGLYEVIGRSSRFVKIYGLRIDLQRVEAALSAGGVTAICTDDDDRLVVAAVGHDEHAAQGITVSASGLPPAAIRVITMDELPLLPSGKPDYQAVRDIARRTDELAQSPADLRALFADVLQIDSRTIRPDQSFVDLGGNSLSYVAMSVRLERALGRLPVDWQRRSVADSGRISRPERRSWPWLGATLETSVALRAAAIVLIVGSHATLYEMWGGAHLLLGIAGYNFGRFCLTFFRAPTGRYLRTDGVDRGADRAVGGGGAGDHRRLYGVESVAGQQVPRPERQHDRGSTVVHRSGGVDSGRACRRLLATARRPVGAAVAVRLRGRVPGVRAGPALRRVRVRPRRRRVVHGARVLVLRGRLGRGEGDQGLAAGRGHGRVGHRPVGLLLELRARRVGVRRSRTADLAAHHPVPTAVAVVAGTVAEASLYVYLTHYQVYPLFGRHVVLGVIASVAVGVLLTQLVATIRHQIRDRGLLPVSRSAVPARR